MRRRFVAEKYAVLIDALYSDRDKVLIETEVTFEDGRLGSIKAELIIHDVLPVEVSTDRVMAA